MTEPTPVTPVDAAGAEVEDRLGARTAEVPPALLDRIASSGAAVLTDDDARAEAGRDWWPLAIGWAAEGAVPQRPALVVRPVSAAQVAEVLAACNEAVVPVTAAAGRSGVCGGVDTRPRRRGPRHDGHRGRRGRRRDLPHRGRARRHLRPGPRGRARDGRGRLHPGSLAPVDGPLDGRWLAGLPGCRSVLHPLREDRGHGRRPRGRAGRRQDRAHGGQGSPRRHRTEPDAALRGQ